MGLFDNKPLTDAEVAERELCECGHLRKHHVLFAIRKCMICQQCKGFALADRHREEGE